MHQLKLPQQYWLCVLYLGKVDCIRSQTFTSHAGKTILELSIDGHGDGEQEKELGGHGGQLLLSISLQVGVVAT